jgi:hypothetical protein
MGFFYPKIPFFTVRSVCLRGRLFFVSTILFNFPHLYSYRGVNSVCFFNIIIINLLTTLPFMLISIATFSLRSSLLLMLMLPLEKKDMAKLDKHFGTKTASLSAPAKQSLAPIVDKLAKKQLPLDKLENTLMDAFGQRNMIVDETMSILMVMAIYQAQQKANASPDALFNSIKQLTDQNPKIGKRFTSIINAPDGVLTNMVKNLK